MSEIKIMLLEDDFNLAELIKMYLISENWEINIFHTGKEALEELEKNKYDLLLLDILLPDINGFEICKKIRETSTMPIIMLTALEDSIHKVQGLNLGADDYIVKPFEPSELIARINSHFRRNYIFAQNIENNMNYDRKINNLRISIKTHKVYYGNIAIELTPKEFEILWLLMEEPGKVYNMDDIHYKIWGDKMLENEVNPVMVHIRRIRSKFEKLGLKSVILTVWGVGYKINV